MNTQTPFIQDHRKLPSTKYISKTKAQFSHYFSGKLKKFTLPLDLQGTEFDKKVWKTAQKISYGKVCTYKEIAQKIGQPLASRAVGNALGRNPIPILVPCHRVIASDGTLGGYSSGLKIKKMLLSLENP
ncbi:MAG: methylated-DNA--[protein]-cysteine S-methyltransferase [Deltaproteobacteria bacterium]|nr:methylated-DNA--[protein]-cysteine S-methyltransferase [Deltaproteobacteria bacterium]